MDDEAVPKLSAMPTEFDGPSARWYTRVNRDLMLARNEVYALFGHSPGGESPVERDEDLLDADPNRSPLHTVIGVGHGWTMNLEEFTDFDRDAWLTSATEVADSMAAQLTRGMLEHIGKVCDDNGNTISAEGRDKRDVLLDALEGMEFSFDENGQHNLTLVMHPDAAKAMAKLPFTDEHQRRFDNILTQKLEAWNAARRPRDLP